MVSMTLCSRIHAFANFHLTINRLVEGIIFSIVGIVGFFGNLLSILVLISPQVRTTSSRGLPSTFQDFSKVDDSKLQSFCI